MFQSFFSFEGRMRRSTFVISRISTGIIAAFLIVLCVFILPDTIGLVPAFMVYVAAVWAALAQGAKRCHDRGNSGWFQLIPFYEFVMLFGDGEPFENQYGPDPKGRDGIRPTPPDLYTDILDAERKN
jgi:uncharacterized membrane protein YhaH (DUF805 family)